MTPKNCKKLLEYLCTQWRNEKEKEVLAVKDANFTYATQHNGRAAAYFDAITQLGKLLDSPENSDGS